MAMEADEATTRFYKRILLAGASITSLTTMVVTIRRQIDATNRIPMKELMRGRDPRAVAYLYSTGALGTATILTGLAGVGVMTGIWSYMGVTNFREFNIAVRAAVQRRFPSLVKTRDTDINSVPEGIVESVDPTADKDLREMVEAVLKEMRTLDKQEDVQKEQKDSQLRTIFRKAFPWSQPTAGGGGSSGS
ncbi:hypothetical protein DFJ74DRAFT_9027 [Hyaloraphidium curvatum]|nr:hypothetical protein DFJ74DRAFT_9027 [Hyaloraphidium curvatum]